MRSDGNTPFVNEDFGLSVVFPKDDPVCLSRSGDASRGFFVQYADPPGCSERPDRPARFVSLYSDWNAAFEPTLAAAVWDQCRALSPALRRAIGDRPLAFPGRASIVCQPPADAEGGIELMVYTAVGEQDGEERGTRVPERTYFAALGSTPGDLHADLERFRRIMATVRIEGSIWKDAS